MGLLMVLLTIIGALLALWSIIVIFAAFATLKGGAKFLVLITALGWIILGLAIAGL